MDDLGRCGPAVTAPIRAHHGIILIWRWLPGRRISACEVLPSMRGLTFRRPGGKSHEVGARIFLKAEESTEEFAIGTENEPSPNQDSYKLFLYLLDDFLF